MRQFTSMVIAGLLALPACGQVPTDSPEAVLPDHIEWVALYHRDLVDWLYNPYLIDDLCSEPAGSEQGDACRRLHLAPRDQIVIVRERPEADAPVMARLRIRASPGEALSADLVLADSTRQLIPDLYLADWGYGPPYFHQTLLERRDPWFRIALPEVGPAWVDTREWSGSGGGPAGSRAVPEIIRLTADESVVTTPMGDLVILDIRDGIVVARPEQPADMWCDPEDIPALEDWREVRIPFSDLLDHDSRIRVTFKYMKGC